MSFLSRALHSWFFQLLLLLCAVWHSLLWYLERTSSNSGEYRAFVAVVTLAALFAIGRKRNERQENLNDGSLIAIVSVLGAYVISLLWAPNLIQFWFATCALAILMWSNCDSGRRNLVGFVGLAILSSPLFASMEFFVGYPLRSFAAVASSWLLNSVGMKVTVYGTMFFVDSRMIGVDAPCSGIKMLWAGLYLCFLLCCLRRLSFLNSVLLAIFSMVTVVLMNTVRVAALVPLELSKLNGADIPDFAHPSAGITALAALIAIVSFIALKLKGDSRDQLVRSIDGKNASLNRPTEFRGGVNLVYAASCIGVAIFSLIVVEHRGQLLVKATDMNGSTNWPNEFEGRALTPQAILPEPSNFKAFTGKVGRFTDGRNEVLFREVQSVTRQLHSSSDCFQGSGFSIEPMALFRDKRGRIWSRFQARRKDETLVVREIVSDRSSGQSWSDVSAWYWAALFGKTRGPWLATTVATRLGPPTSERARGLTPRVSYASGR